MRLSPPPLPLWLALQLAPPAPAPPAAAGFVPVYAATEPLIGGPPFLALHVCVRHADLLIDFVPRRPTEVATGISLLSGGGVDGQIRCRPASVSAPSDRWRLLGYSARTSEEMEAYARRQPDMLSLRTNNCWTFARALIDYAEYELPSSQTDR